MIACNSNNCDELGQGGNLVISDATKMSISNYDDAETVVFEDQQNQEVKFTIIERHEFYDDLRFQVACDEDPSEVQTITTAVELIEIRLVNRENPSSDTIFIALIRTPTSVGNS